MLYGVPAFFYVEHWTLNIERWTLNVEHWLMNYDKQILDILTRGGERGISVQAMSKHVYNMNRTFFVSPDFEEIRNYVQQYLLKNSKSDHSLIERTEQRGWYRLNTMGSNDAQQLMLQFRDEQQPIEEVKQPEDLSLSLFDTMI